jgi:signal transduction histidine kinase
MTDQQIIFIHALLSFAVGVIFFYQGILNFIIHRQGILRTRETKYIYYLCFLSALYSFLNYYLLQEHPKSHNLHALTLNWMVASLICYTYIRSMQSFLNAHSQVLNIIIYFPLAGGLGALIAEILFLFTDINLIFDPVSPTLNYANIFMIHIGGHNPHPFLKALVPFYILPTLVSLYVFMRHLSMTAKSYPLLRLGITLSFVGILTDGTLAMNGKWFKYVPPLLFLTNFFEILRITFSNQMRAGRKIFELEDDLIQSHKLTEAGDYFAKLAHEIANPLYAARSYFEMLMSKVDQKEFTPKMKKYQHNIEQQFMHIQDLLSNVKDLTRPTQTRLFEAESVSSIIDTSLGMTKIKAYHAGVELKLEVEENLTILCYRDQIVQVLSNLINNGIEAIQETGGWVRVKASKSSQVIEMRVTDSGPGIAEENLKKIFEKRFSTKKEKGNGLGLSICKTIIENHSGEIFVDKNAGLTEFVVRLPSA